MLIEVTYGTENHYRESSKTSIFVKKNIESEDHLVNAIKNKLGVKLLNKRHVLDESSATNNKNITIANLDVDDGLIIKIYTCYVKSLLSGKAHAALYLRCRSNADYLEIKSKAANKDGNFPNYYFKGNFDVLKESDLRELGINIPMPFYPMSKDSNIQAVFEFNVLRRGESLRPVIVTESVEESGEIVHYKKSSHRRIAI